jgi:hypothetical protein
MDESNPFIMNTNESKTIVNDVFDAQMKTLMTIRDFRRDFITHSQLLKELSQDLISIYQEGLDFFQRFGNPDYHKEADETLNNIRVEANQMHHVLDVSDDFMHENKKDHDFLSEYRDFNSRKNDFKAQSLHFEALGDKHLEPEHQDEWNQRFKVWTENFEPQFERESKYIKLIYDFEDKYSHEDLVRITQILNENTAEERNWDDPAVFQQEYIKAIKEFQREFRPRNLWDNIMEILAGGVHPSPSERIMLEQWTDGEQKTREDM